MTPQAAIPYAPGRPLDLLDHYGPGSSAPPPSLDEARRYTRALATGHYENFSVLSSLVPARLRDDFAAVYAYCRWSDDLADETGATDEARARSLELLAWWRTQLHRCFESALSESAESGPPSHPVFVALADTARRHHLPLEPFDRLLDAFEQDQRVTAYESWEQLLAYCRGSANPVGWIVLHLFGHPRQPGPDAGRHAQSDAVCTALQLTNFWQDVRRDLLERGRVYLPRAETGLDAGTLREWAARPDDPGARIPFIRALRPLVERTRAMFDEGAPLPGTLGPEARPVVGLFVAGGRHVLAGVERSGCTTLWQRPTLTPLAKAGLVARAWLAARLRHPGAPAA